MDYNQMLILFHRLNIFPKEKKNGSANNQKTKELYIVANYIYNNLKYNLTFYVP